MVLLGLRINLKPNKTVNFGQRIKFVPKITDLLGKKINLVLSKTDPSFLENKFKTIKTVLLSLRINLKPTNGSVGLKKKFKTKQNGSVELKNKFKTNKWYCWAKE